MFRGAPATCTTCHTTATKVKAGRPTGHRSSLSRHTPRQTSRHLSRLSLHLRSAHQQVLASFDNWHGSAKYAELITIVGAFVRHSEKQRLIYWFSRVVVAITMKYVKYNRDLWAEYYEMGKRCLCIHREFKGAKICKIKYIGCNRDL